MEAGGELLLGGVAGPRAQAKDKHIREKDRRQGVTREGQGGAGRRCALAAAQG